MYRQQLVKRLNGRGAYEITDKLKRMAQDSGVMDGLCHVFIHHTSASLMICENADATVLGDVERFMARWIPDGDRLFQHDYEGEDDMPAHLRSIFTHTQLSIPVAGGRLDVGTWQGVFVYEHRFDAFERKITVSVFD